MATREETLERIARLEESLEALENLADQFALTGMTQRYKVNNGQSIVETEYKTAQDIENAINLTERRITKLRERLRGRFVKLKARDSFFRRKGWL
jgi:hypothetical protein